MSKLYGIKQAKAYLAKKAKKLGGKWYWAESGQPVPLEWFAAAGALALAGGK